MNRTLQSCLAIAVILLGGFVCWQLILAAQPELPTAPPRDVGPPRVTFDSILAQDLTIEVQAYGNLKANHVVHLTAELAGRVVQVFEDWRPGVGVEAGQLLVQLDSTLLELDVASARAQLAETEAAVGVVSVEQANASADRQRLGEALKVAQRQYARFVDLGSVASDLQRDTALTNQLNAERALEVGAGRQATSAASLVSAQAKVESAQATLAQAEEWVTRTRIVAPFAGRLRGHGPGLGTLTSMGLVLGELVDPDSTVLEVHVPERDLLLLKPGMKVQLVFPNTPETDEGERLAGLVSAVDIASNTMTRRGLVEIELAIGTEQIAALPAGLFARAMIEVEKMKGVIWIDRRHFRWEGAEAVAYVVGDGAGGVEEPVAKRRVLKLWREHGEGFVVLEGLQAGERLITMPLDRMGQDVPVLPTQMLLERVTEPVQ